MALKHKIIINVTDSKGNKSAILRAADMKLPSRIIQFLFGDFRQIYLLDVGQSIESVDINEVKEIMEGDKSYESSEVIT